MGFQIHTNGEVCSVIYIPNLQYEVKMLIGKQHSKWIKNEFKLNNKLIACVSGKTLIIHKDFKNYESKAYE